MNAVYVAIVTRLLQHPGIQLDKGNNLGETAQLLAGFVDNKDDQDTDDDEDDDSQITVNEKDKNNQKITHNITRCWVGGWW